MGLNRSNTHKCYTMKQVGNMWSRRDIKSVYDRNYADGKHLRQSWNNASFINYLWRFCRQQSVLLGERNSDNKSRTFARCQNKWQGVGSRLIKLAGNVNRRWTFAPWCNFRFPSPHRKRLPLNFSEAMTTATATTIPKTMTWLVENDETTCTVCATLILVLVHFFYIISKTIAWNFHFMVLMTKQI